MKAARLKAYGEGENALTLENTDQPVAGVGQAVIEVTAAGVNPFDVKLRDGAYAEQIKLPLPATLGGDFAGIITELGPQPAGFELGQVVYGQAKAASGQGAFAEYTAAPVSQLALKPTTTDFITSAGLPLVSSSAHQALIEHMQLEAGQTILIHGGAGGIGSMAIQLAKNIGARVITTAMADNADYVKGLGADEVIDYRAVDFSQVVSDVDAVFDTVGGQTTDKSYLVLKPAGIIVSMISGPNDELVQKYKTRFIQQSTKVTTERLSEIAKLVDSGQLKLRVAKVFPLDQAGQALEYLKVNHPPGKVVISVK